eukprot:TRINITY_DN3027_c0_g3_i1.p1 TRINITY_DN3027_c0_g3~~TRINITY_DN3027_c0_g3_i1.p1  ORF type:complete len:266 (+),score=56.00 TRINITY_DN3027_c0_g3_i1:316-1113(+)
MDSTTGEVAEIFVRNLQNKTRIYKVDLMRNTTMDLKKMILNFEGVYPCLQRLTMGTVQLEDSRVLIDHGVYNGSTLYLLMRIGSFDGVRGRELLSCGGITVIPELQYVKAIGLIDECVSVCKLDYTKPLMVVVGLNAVRHVRCAVCDMAHKSSFKMFSGKSEENDQLLTLTVWNNETGKKVVEDTEAFSIFSEREWQMLDEDRKSDLEIQRKFSSSEQSSSKWNPKTQYTVELCNQKCVGLRWSFTTTSSNENDENNEIGETDTS